MSSETPTPMSGSDRKAEATAVSSSSASSASPIPSSEPPRFPMAQIREAKATAEILGTSKLWWAAAVCLIIAFWLTWKSIPANGPTVTIHFPEGHGLKSGDVVRHRGIEVGAVSEVALSDDLTQITATVILTPGASGLAREGTRFWIVRPQLSLTGVSGLETAVGSKYIAVSPGEASGASRFFFDGLASAPPDSDSSEGLDLVLRSDGLHGVTVGAPVTWRGIEVGRILSTGLSPDARFVDIHARIFSEYRRLVRPGSKFWVTSGLGVDVGLSGLKLNADSLSTILRGGISFTTPAINDNDPQIKSGSMFILNEKADPEWLRAATSLPLIDVPLPTTVTVQGTRRTTTLGIPRTQKFTANAIVLRNASGETTLMSASDIVPIADASTEDKGTEAGAAPASTEMVLSLSVIGRESPLNVSVKRPAELPGDLAGLELAVVNAPAELTVSSASIRKATAPEDCCLCRSVLNEGKASSVIQCWSQDELRVVEGKPSQWSVVSESGDLTAWHGAPVISMNDGRLIGVFVLTASGPVVSVIQ